jgi:hypothetical protein
MSLRGASPFVIAECNKPAPAKAGEAISSIKGLPRSDKSELAMTENIIN